MSVRKHGLWNTRDDEAVIEYLRDHDLAGPAELARALSTPVSVRRVRERLRVLSQAGYIAPLTDDYEQFELTEWGRLYISGDIRADLLVPEPDPRRPGYVRG